MKKSILWTAAGVVSATAIWAAISLPQHCPARRATRLITPQLTTTLLIRDSNGGSMTHPLPAEPCTIEWTGNTIKVRSKTTWGENSYAGPSRPIQLLITHISQQRGPNFSSSSMHSISRTFQPGEKLQL
ncbi:hypothetical protein [Armatimonas sp.]|uniref:hypothetical protein n=1 Tax=Armatimonas sp. TaxID=1872638 RepID=UPI00374CD045